MSEQPDAFQDDAATTWTPHDDLPAYALGLLDPAERSEFERHLADCPACQKELPAHTQLSELLPHSLEPASPPAGARDRLLARARAETAPPAASSSPAPEPEPKSEAEQTSAAPTAQRPGPEPVVQVDEPPPPPRRAALEPIPVTRPPQRPRQKRIRLASLGWAAALLFVLASGLFVGVWSATGPHASLSVEMQARLPGGRILPLAGTGVPTAKARLFVVGGGRTAELAVDRLPGLPEGRVYQLWFAEPGEAIKSGGTFTVDARGDAVAQVTIPAPLERIRGVAVTEEPAPGSPSPTGRHLLNWST